MKRQLAILTLLASTIYGATAYTRPHEPAGRMLHGFLHHIKQALPEFPRVPFSGLLKFDNDYQPRPSLHPLEVVPPAATGYTPEELSEIYSSH